MKGSEQTTDSSDEDLDFDRLLASIFETSVKPVDEAAGRAADLERENQAMPVAVEFYLEARHRQLLSQACERLGCTPAQYVRRLVQINIARQLAQGE